MEVLNVFESLLSDVFRLSKVQLFFFLVVYFATAWFFTKEKMGRFFLSIWLFVTCLFQNPILYFRSTIKSTINLKDNLRQNEGILLHPIFSFIRMSVALSLLFFLSSVVATTFFVMEPDSYWTERFDSLQRQLVDLEQKLVQQNKELTDFKSSIPALNKNGQDPRLEEAKKGYEPHKEEHEQKKVEVKKSKEIFLREKENLPSGYRTSEILSYIEKQYPLSYKKYKTVKSNIRSYCSCSDYNVYLEYWRKEKRAKKDLDKYEKGIEDVLQVISDVEMQIAEEQNMIENQEINISYTKKDIVKTKKNIEEADENNNIQFVKGIQFFFFGILQFLGFTWFVGLFEESIQFIWKRINDIKEIRDLLQKNISSANEEYSKVSDAGKSPNSAQPPQVDNEESES